LIVIIQIVDLMIASPTKGQELEVWIRLKS